jgi:predicted enzyme involved in methoxymalonyl-ACP biosynthesis
MKENAVKENVLLNESFVKIWHDTETQILHANWKGFLQPNQVKKGCDVMTEYIKKKGVSLHLSNHMELKVLSKEVQEYLTQQWFPATEKVGLRKIAALVSEDVFAKATVDKVNSTGKVGKLTIATFNSEYDSENWLLGKA